MFKIDIKKRNTNKWTKKQTATKDFFYFCTSALSKDISKLAFDKMDTIWENVIIAQMAEYNRFYKTGDLTDGSDRIVFKN